MPGYPFATALPDDHLFITGGYKGGSAMLQMQRAVSCHLYPVRFAGLNRAHRCVRTVIPKVRGTGTRARSGNCAGIDRRGD